VRMRVNFFVRVSFRNGILSHLEIIDKYASNAVNSRSKT